MNVSKSFKLFLLFWSQLKPSVKCLTSIKSKPTEVPLANYLLGEILTADQQCQTLAGPDARFCIVMFIINIILMNR